MAAQRSISSFFERGASRLNGAPEEPAEAPAELCDARAGALPPLADGEAGVATLQSLAEPVTQPERSSPLPLRVFTRKRPAERAGPGEGAPAHRSQAPAEQAPAEQAPAVERAGGASQAPLRGAPVRGAPKFKQLYLDLGQADFGHATCGECGMVYARGEASDERTHAAFHARAREATPFRGWTRERVLWRQEGCPVTRILHVAPGDPAAHQCKAGQLGALVTSALGLPEGWLLSGDCAHTFLYVAASQTVVGLLVAQPLQQAQRVVAGGSGGVVLCHRQLQPCRAGVRAVWVHARARRTRVATRLLEACLRGLGPGCALPRNLLAFSQPTPEGRALAEAFTGTPSFLVFQ